MKDIFCSSTRWVVGEGNISFWNCNWSGYGDLRTLLQDEEMLFDLQDNLKLHEVIAPNGSWNLSIFQEPVPTSLLHLLEGTRVRFNHGSPDEFVWIHTTHGQFSIKTAWEAVHHSAQAQSVYQHLWH